MLLVKVARGKETLYETTEFNKNYGNNNNNVVISIKTSQKDMRQNIS